MTAVTIELDADHIPVLLPLVRAAALKESAGAARARNRKAHVTADDRLVAADAWHALRVALEGAGERESGRHGPDMCGLCGGMLWDGEHCDTCASSWPETLGVWP